MRVLVVGSAPHIAEWWPRHGCKAMQAGYSVRVINNAVHVTGHATDIWYASWDYQAKGGHWHMIPTCVPRFPTTGMWWLMDPMWYTPPPGAGARTACVMFLDVLWHELNRAIMGAYPLEVATIGCDLIYDSGKAHFYEGGTPDPLRFGEQWLNDALDETRQAYGEAGMPIGNLASGPSRLPFQRVTLS